MSRIKVLGIGSPFGEDQAGWKAADLLSQRPALRAVGHDQLCIERHDRPGVRLLELMRGDSVVYLIDAVMSGGLPGSLYRLEDMDIDQADCNLSSHAIGVAQTVQLGRALEQLPPSLIFYGIEITQPLSRSGFSSVVNLAVDKLVQQLETEILSRIFAR